MKIAIMMRAMDQDSGFRTYIEGLVDGMLRIDNKNAYLLFYRTTKWFGRFSSFENVQEVLLPAGNKLVWDQVAVPYRAWKEGADITFNPKFSVPLISHCPVAMGLQEPAWWAWPRHYEWWDLMYNKMMLPRYCRKAARLFPMSKFILDENRKYLGLSLDHATVAYPAPSKHIGLMDDTATLEKIRDRYRLPSRFILSVTRVDHVGNDTKSFYPGKNIETALRAFALCRKQIPHQHVIAGRQVKEYLLQQGWGGADFEGVRFLNFVPHEELAALYNLADLFVIPSFYEGFGFTLVEAMACGCPVIASKAGACPEVTGGAALLADPLDPADFAAKILTVLNNEDLRQKLRKRSLRRAGFFNWEVAARLTLRDLTQAVNRSDA
jgi:glycosyltransferase involved in cell wall biosynthesis